MAMSKPIGMLYQHEAEYMFVSLPEVPSGDRLLFDRLKIRAEGGL